MNGFFFCLTILVRPSMYFITVFGDMFQIRLLATQKIFNKIEMFFIPNTSHSIHPKVFSPGPETLNLPHFVDPVNVVIALCCALGVPSHSGRWELIREKKLHQPDYFFWYKGLRQTHFHSPEFQWNIAYKFLSGWLSWNVIRVDM